MKEKSTLKHPLPNTFHCTAFKKHHLFLLDKHQKKAQYSKMFLYLPSTLHRKKDFLQWKDHIHLHPVDVNYDDMKTSKNDGSMTPALSDDRELTKEVTGGYYEMMKKIAEISNQNLA